MSPPPESTHDVFLNVRKAYRLLHDYQRMVIDVVLYIAAYLDIPEWTGYANFAGDASAGARKLRNPSWDWLPMIGWAFHFTKERGNDEWVSLSFLIISDTGFIEGDETENHKENTGAFAPAAESSTRLAFFLYDTHAHRFPIAVTDKKRMKDFIRTGGGLPEGVVGKCYNMTDVTNETEANEIVMDIVGLAKENSFPLELKKGLPQA